MNFVHEMVNILCLCCKICVYSRPRDLYCPLSISYSLETGRAICNFRLCQPEGVCYLDKEC
jgi:hypothetical protein